MKRKLLTLLLSLAMVVTMIPMTAVGSFAASTSPFTKAQLEEPFYIQATATDGAKVSFKNDDTLGVNLLYKINSGLWQDYKLGNEIELKQNDKVYFKAGSEDNPALKNTEMYSSYSSSGFFFEGETKLGGNIMSLLDGQKFSTMTKFPEGSKATFEGIFTDGSDLISVKDLILPAMELAPYCYQEMFERCENITEGPVLPATGLAEGCYSAMFAECKNLIAAPKLPATKLAIECYENMFGACDSLIDAPKLPATNMKEGCYKNMFAFCSNLENAPELPATKLADGCYNTMFQYCFSLKKAPALPATKLMPNCYWSMFQFCYSLEEVKVAFTQWDEDALTTWLDGVPEDITFICKPELIEDMNTNYIKGKSDILPPANCTIRTDYYNRNEVVEKIYENSTFTAKLSNIASKAKLVAMKFTNSLPPLFASLFKFKEQTPFYFEAVEGGTQVKLQKEGELEVQLLYKLNSDEWKEYSYDDEVVLENAGDKVYFKAVTQNDTFCNVFINTYEIYAQDSNSFVVSTGSAKLGGNIMSLLDGENFSTKTSLSPKNEGTFCNLFADNENITSAKDLLLPATELVRGCYARMFEGCSALQEAPKLPAKTMKTCCYSDMFSKCTALTEAPELPATKLATGCYFEMFNTCTTLKKAPYLPAKELAYACYYQMFTYCTSLQEAELPAEVLCEECYSAILYGCTSLKCVKLGLTEWNDPNSNKASVWLGNTGEGGTIICTPELVNRIHVGIEVPEGWKLVPEYSDNSSLKESIWTIISFPTRMFNILTTADIVLKKVGILSFLGLSK